MKQQQWTDYLAFLLLFGPLEPLLGTSSVGNRSWRRYWAQCWRVRARAGRRVWCSGFGGWLRGEGVVQVVE